MSKTYRLVTLADLLTIPIDKLSECLLDIKYAIITAHLAGGEHISAMKFDHMDWTDDDRHDVSMTLNGEPCLTLEVTKECGDERGG